MELYGPQDHPPRREAQSDFTHGNCLGGTIAGRPYPHILFQLILSHSSWRYAGSPPARPCIYQLDFF